MNIKFITTFHKFDPHSIQSLNYKQKDGLGSFAEGEEKKTKETEKTTTVIHTLIQHTLAYNEYSMTLP